MNLLAISKETLKAIIRDYGGFQLSDDELDLVAPEVEAYLAEASQLDELDLSTVLSGRLLRVSEGGETNA